MTTSIIDALRQHRIADIAVFDVAASFFGAYLLSPLLVDTWHVFVSQEQLYFSVIPLGVVIHLALGQDTRLNRYLFTEKTPVAWAVVAYLSYRAIRLTG